MRNLTIKTILQQYLGILVVKIILKHTQFSIMQWRGNQNDQEMAQIRRENLQLLT